MKLKRKNYGKGNFKSKGLIHSLIGVKGVFMLYELLDDDGNISGYSLFRKYRNDLIFVRSYYNLHAANIGLKYAKFSS
jgi:hypothetical protein